MSTEEFSTYSEAAQSESLNNHAGLQSELPTEGNQASQPNFDQPLPHQGVAPQNTIAESPQMSQNPTNDRVQNPQYSPNFVNNPVQNSQPQSQEPFIQSQQISPQATNNVPVGNPVGTAPIYQNPNMMVNPATPNGAPVQGAYVVVPQAKPGRTKRIVWSIVGAVAAIILLVGGIFLYRQLSGNVDGTYQVKSMQKDLEDELKDTNFDKGTISYSSFTDNAKVETTIKDDKVKATVSYDVNYDNFYDEVKSNFSSYYSDYKDDFSNDEWNYLMNSLIKKASLDQKGFEKTFSSEVENEGLDYDSDKGQVSGTLFEGKVDRVSGKIEMTKVNSDSELTSFEKGEKVSYKKTSSGLTLTDAKGHTVSLNLK